MRAQRRRIQKFVERLDLVMEADRRYFERFPRRRHRVRVASQVEIELAELIGGEMSPPPGSQHYVAVRFLTPSIRLPLVVLGPVDADPELYDEESARQIFEINEDQEAREVQAALLEQSK
jgi:hypothetical protein